MIDFFSVIKACATFVFGSNETPVGKGVILARFKIYLLRKGGFDGAADEIEEEARLRRELRVAEIRAKTKKHEARRIQDEMTIDKGIEILEKRRAGGEAKRAELVERQDAQVKHVQNTAEQQKALDDLNRKRDENARDAAEYLRGAESKIRLAGGKVRIDKESLKALSAYAHAAKQEAEEARLSTQAAKREREEVTEPAPPAPSTPAAPPAEAKPAPSVRGSRVRIAELSKELGVPSKAIIAKCVAEGIPPDIVKSHVSIVPIGLAMSIREWFSTSASDSAVEAAAKVEIEEPRVKVARAKKKAKATVTSDQSESQTGRSLPPVS